MIKRFYFLLSGIMLFSSSIFSKSLLKKNINLDSCQLFVDSIWLEQATIVNSTLGKVIDSALSIIEIGNSKKYNIPVYYLELYPHESDIIGQQRISILANNWFVNRPNLNDAIAISYSNAAFIFHNGYQIIINKVSCNSWLKEYIKIESTKKPYFIYSLFKGNRDIICQPQELRKQKVTFQLWPGRFKPYSFEEYSLSIYDDSFIYDNEFLNK